MLKDTTIGSGRWEGITGNFHEYCENGAPEGAGYLYFVGDEPDAGRFEAYLEENPGAIDLWLGGHTHAGPGMMHGQKTHMERKWDVTFFNVGQMMKYHTGPDPAQAMTRQFIFVPDKALSYARCYLHPDDRDGIGWYSPEIKRIPLHHKFSGLEERPGATDDG